ncbi:MAG TPA: ATP-binding cassette domain-containing protein, partial [Myxococcales bacterium]|nr:ATP-binding cassette domain-containing protein [Myxococcales bacterium]
MLEVRKLMAWYGESHVLHGVDLDVKQGELITIVGRNGAGKTTTMKSIMGLVRRRTGSVKMDGVETISLPPHRIARLGIELCPEERGIFATLDVKENLLLPPQVRPGGLDLDSIFLLFPNLRERLASQGTK